MIYKTFVKTKNQKKIIIGHKDLLPKLVLADPLLTYSMPAHIAAATGMDAFTHLLESFCVDVASLGLEAISNYTM